MTIVVPPGFWEFLEYIRGEDTGSRNGQPPIPPISRATRSDRVPIPKKRRKVSRYQKVFGKHLKALKKKHPRTDISVLMKKAHRLTRRELK